MADRRRVKRKYLMFYTRVFDAGHGKLIGHLVDITPAGAMLISEHSLPAGQDLCLRMELSPEVSDQLYLELAAHSLWCRPDVNPKFYTIGFQLQSITPETAGIINRIVAAYGFRDN